MELRRDGQTVKLSQFPMEEQTFTVDGQEVELYGMQFATEKKTAGGLLKMAWNNSLYFVQLVKLGLHDLVTGAVGLKDMSGPVGIVEHGHGDGQPAGERLGRGWLSCCTTSRVHRHQPRW